MSIIVNSQPVQFLAYVRTMRHTPTTPAFFEEELAPLFADVIGYLLDDPEEAHLPGVLDFTFTQKGDIEMTVRLPRASAGRVTGRQHMMRDSLHRVFRAISMNHGFVFSSLIIVGLDDHGQELPASRS